MSNEHPRRSRGDIGAPVSISLVDNGTTCSRVYGDHDRDMDHYEHGKAYTQYSTGDRSACVSYGSVRTWQGLYTILNWR